MDTDALQRTLDAVDAITTCGWCRRKLTADSPSPNFCSEEHQDCWHADQADIGALIASAAPDVDTLAENLLEAARIWNEPAQLGQVVGEVVEDLAARHYRGWLARRLSYGAHLNLPASSALLRNITVA